MDTQQTKYAAIACLIVFGVLAAAGILSPTLALIAGALVSIILGNPAPKLTSASTKLILTVAVIGLGAGVEWDAILATGIKGALFTVCTLTLALMLGRFLSRKLGMDPRTGILVTVGTAICGGSAIAAAAPALHADDDEIGTALATVFLLNGVALLIFPPIGELLHMSGEQFGSWAALAVHDMSSVVGTAASFAQGSLDVAVPMKLTRALWIIPVTFMISRHPAAQRETEEGVETTGTQALVPPVVIGFLLSVLFFAVVPAAEAIREPTLAISHRLLVVAILLVGTTIQRDQFKRSGVRPLLLGVLLWIPLAVFSLLLVKWLG